MATTPLHLETEGRRQFTLAGLLSFFLAGSVYLSMLASAGPMFQWRSERPWWPLLVTTPTAWIILVFLYPRWGVRQALAVHFVGPVLTLSFAVPISLLAILFGDHVDGATFCELIGMTGLAALYGCGVSTAVSLPAAVAMLVYLGARRRKANG